MDRGRFDALARLVFRTHSRRAALAAILGATLVPHPLPTVLAKSKKKGKAKGKRKRHPGGVAPVPLPPAPLVPVCFPGDNCFPVGQGTVNEDCDFAFSNLFVDLDAHGAVLSRANFTNAALFQANLRGAVLADACLVNANLLHAQIDNSTVLDGAIFCNTVMPDGSFNNSGCDRGTACCPTTPPPGGTCRGRLNLCGLFAGDCCEGLTCTSTFDPLVFSCQRACQSNADCLPGTHCDVNHVVCNFLFHSKCCVSN
jgi:hypothetical protein